MVTRCASLSFMVRVILLLLHILLASSICSATTLGTYNFGGRSDYGIGLAGWSPVYHVGVSVERFECYESQQLFWDEVPVEGQTYTLNSGTDFDHAVSLLTSGPGNVYLNPDWQRWYTGGGPMYSVDFSGHDITAFNLTVDDLGFWDGGDISSVWASWTFTIEGSRPVPEPSTFIAFGIGLGFLAIFRRKYLLK